MHGSTPSSVPKECNSITVSCFSTLNLTNYLDKKSCFGTLNLTNYLDKKSCFGTLNLTIYLDKKYKYL
jgi:hypothetical protein